MRRISFWNCVPGEDQWYHLCTWRRSVVPPMYLKKISGANYVPGEGQWCHLCTWRRSGPAAAHAPACHQRTLIFPVKQVEKISQWCHLYTVPGEDQWCHLCTWRRSLVPPMYLKKIRGATYVPGEGQWCHICTWRRSGPAAAHAPACHQRTLIFPIKQVEITKDNFFQFLLFLLCWF